MAFRKWKPNAAQKAEYAAKMREKESLPIIRPNGAIRTGCRVKYYSMNKGEVIEGSVVSHSYGAEAGQHTFKIEQEGGSTILVKGRNLYPNLLEHIQGEESLTESRK